MHGPVTALESGDRLGPYLLEAKVGRGASAEVWRATDDNGNLVAVKARRIGDPQMDRRFLREFESMRSLRLPGVVRVFEAGTEDSWLWFSMELVDGVPFDHVLKTAPTEVERVRRLLHLAIQLFDMLAALHAAGFVHRDVKPSNVLVDESGKVRILDFGIVRFFADRDTTITTTAGQVLGTLPYMAPEQLTAMPSDAKVDLFACGTMLWEGLHGPRQRPALAIGWIPRTVMDRPISLATRLRHVPLGLSGLLDALMRVRPEERPTAAEAARTCRRLQSDQSRPDQPAATWVDPGSWLSEVEGCLGVPERPAVWVLEGPAGSGKRRTAEYLHRMGLLQAVWPVHITCQVNDMGGALRQLMDHLLTYASREGWASRLAELHGNLIRRMWPQLQVAGGPPATELPTIEHVSEAVAEVVSLASEHRPIVIMVHELEQVDELTAMALHHIAERCSLALGMLLLHDPRWSTEGSRRLVGRLVARGGTGHHVLEDLPSDAMDAIAASLCPEAPPTGLEPGTPQAAVEAGLAALAAWRGDTWEPPGPNLWPLAVRPEPVPASVVRELVGARAAESQWVERTERGLVLSTDFARSALWARLGDRQVAARAMSERWPTDGPQSHESLATLLLLAGDSEAAWSPAAGASIEAARLGRYADARRWLLLLDTLPEPAELSNAQRFELAWVRARVALRTEVGSARRSLLDAVQRTASTSEMEARARLVEAEFDLRDGRPTPALVAALRVGSSMSVTAPKTALRALLVAIQARFTLNQLDEVPNQIKRGRALLLAHPDSLLEVQLDNLQAEYEFRCRQLASSRTSCQDIVRKAAALRYVRGSSFGASRLGRLLRMMGRRREAEHQTRTARVGFASTGDVLLDAETGLSLATLLVERGDTPGARHLLDETVRQIRGMHLDDLLPIAMRVALEVAIFRADPTDAAVALAALANTEATDEEIPSVLVRWWRTRGDVDRAMAVEGPAERTGYGHALWLTERARVGMIAGWNEQARDLALEARRESQKWGFHELGTYAHLVLGVVSPVESARWPHILERASNSMRTEIYLGAVEMDARRLHAKGGLIASRPRWRTLLARSRELGYQPGVEEAEGWLAE